MGAIRTILIAGATGNGPMVRDSDPKSRLRALV